MANTYDYKTCEFTRFAQERLNNPNWYPWKFERVVGGVIMTGATCPLKKDGSPNFRLKERNTTQAVVYPMEDVSDDKN